MSLLRIQRMRTRALMASVLALCAAGVLLAGCQGSGPIAGASPDEAGGAPFERPALLLSPFDSSALQGGAPGGGVDISSLAQGYVGAAALSESKLKFLVTHVSSNFTYTYDLPSDGTPIVCPLSMGDGDYAFKIMQNTSGDRYIELGETVLASAQLESEFIPFERPNVYCSYEADSDVVAKADELSKGAENEGAVLERVYSWIADNIKYDTEKAEAINSGTIGSGYVPDPDATLESGQGICFDYASLAAAMLRSQGIPCKIITGSVSPDNIYHAWNLVYLDGSWKSAQISVNPDTWTRIDLTFAAGGATDFTGDGTSYTDRYTY